jgi:hypothetical protein|tara:strand:- start:1153 stop:1341 length:189 start_codon:yes stop_codon:yes gene_type:complete
MSKTTRLAHPPKKKRYVSRYNKGGIVHTDIIVATAEAQKQPLPKTKVVATGDKFNTYKTRIA